MTKEQSGGHLNTMIMYLTSFPPPFNPDGSAAVISIPEVEFLHEIFFLKYLTNWNFPRYPLIEQPKRGDKYLGILNCRNTDFGLVLCPRVMVLIHHRLREPVRQVCAPEPRTAIAYVPSFTFNYMKSITLSAFFLAFSGKQ